jgi:hypothetical protein
VVSIETGVHRSFAEILTASRRPLAYCLESVSGPSFPHQCANICTSQSPPVELIRCPMTAWDEGIGLRNAPLLHMMLIATLAPLLFFAAGSHLSPAHAVIASEHAGVRRGHVRRIQACGALRSANTTYLLTRDVQSPGTCFAIAADNVTLDLNGHTATYGVSRQNHPVFGVLSADCWYAPISGNPCGGGHRGIEIMNGRIVQGAGAPPMSHAIRMGQGNDFTGIKVHGIDITISAEDSIGIYTEYLPGGSDIYDNTIHNNVTVISNRMQFRGASIKLDNETNAKIPDQIHNNVILGGAQLGIRDDNPASTRIYNNDISQDATYTNGFCIDAAGQNMLVYHNHCHPIRGRGIHANHSGVQIFDNVINVVDSGHNLEYKGCEIHGTYGIQVENDNFNPTDVRVYGNHVTARAASCGGDAMRLTDLKGANIEIYDNTFIALQDKIDGVYSDRSAFGLSVGDVIGTHLRFYNNVVQADTAIFYMDWDSGGSITLADNTFQAGRMGSSTLLADFGNGVTPSHDNYFLDNIYQGISPTSARFGTYSGDSWYGILETLHVHAQTSNNAPPHALSGTAIDALNPTPHIGLNDGKGNLTFILPVLRIENQKPPQHFAPYRITLQAPGCNTLDFDLTSPASAPLQRQLQCGSAGN